MPDPDTVFIVPYRDRPAQKEEFHAIMTDYMAERTGWRILYVEQKDDRPFNRGAMKNIGFLTVRDLYPATYRSITLVFHDVDTWPRWKGQLPYRTHPGVVVHHYGKEFALGGIVVIKAADFERTGGFPNFWGWGIEDNVLNDRCRAAGLPIDRSTFFPMGSRSIARPFDGYQRTVSRRDAAVYKYGRPDGLWDIRNMRRKIALDRDTVDVLHFDVPEAPEAQTYEQHDIRHGPKLVADPRFLPPRQRDAYLASRLQGRRRWPTQSG